jgi:hypothetical protein
MGDIKDRAFRGFSLVIDELRIPSVFFKGHLAVRADRNLSQNILLSVVAEGIDTVFADDSLTVCNQDF